MAKDPSRASIARGEERQVGRRGDQWQRIQAGSRLLSKRSGGGVPWSKGRMGMRAVEQMGMGCGSGSCCAHVRELNWRRMGGNRWNGLVVGQGTGRTYHVSHMDSGTNWRWRKMERRTMAKEEEKEGRAVAKDTRKRRSESNRKPDGSSNREDAKPKKKKVEYVVSLGHNSKMSDRHKGQLACLAALVTAKKTDLRATDNMQEILESDANNAGVYMEWSEEEETYFIHARSQSRQLLKFELLVVAGFGAVPEETEIKNPLLVFSEGFGNGGKWEDTKMLLFEINSLPSADKEGSLKQVFATFVLKPVEIQCPDNIYYFLDVEKFLMFQIINDMVSFISIHPTYIVLNYVIVLDGVLFRITIVSERIPVQQVKTSICRFASNGFNVCRFARFFPSDDAIRFKQEDKKPTCCTRSKACNCIFKYLALVNSCERSLLVVNLTDALSNTPGAVHLLLQLHPSIVGHIVAADSIDQSFISCGFTTPGGFDLLPEFLQALLNPFRPGFILPFHKLALIRLFPRVTIVVSVTWSIGTPSCSDG
ncbi:unnamed protein product [Miscanthus lutarioriparius]|uniref:Uncharacterized protein n=1 Tax=Miscanthus lutarioriparius TaxID=422564 RepID=A0A811MLG6_9POAL|nr:unnamed protein product [Miscanthus lutarioriparius]